MENKLVVIDGNSLFYRSFYALPLLTNASGEYSNAVYGFAIQIVKIITEIKPTHLVVAFDAGKHTFRNDLYSGYKATRKSMPPELRCQIKPLKTMLDKMNIKMLEQAEVEGDDIVGSISKKFSDTQTIIVTADRDTLQLIDDTTVVYFTKKGTSDLYIVDEQVLLKDYGVKPNQIVDLKALQGDTSDNIPGVAGVGKVTAQQLVEKYGNLDNIYANLDNISGKVHENLQKGRENAYLSYKLSKIKTDVNIDCTLDDCKYDYPFAADVHKFFSDYEFKSLLKKSEIFSSELKIEKQQQFNITQIENVAQIESLFEQLKTLSEMSVYADKSIIHFGVQNTEYIINLDTPVVKDNIEKIKTNLSQIFSSQKPIVLFDAKQSMHFFTDFGINFETNFFDVSIAKHLVEGISVKSIKDILYDEQSYTVPACIIFELYEQLSKDIANMGMENLYYNVELPLCKVLFDMEQKGFKIDRVVLDELSEKYKLEIAKLEQSIYDEVGFEFNINSPKQLGEVLFDKLNLPHKKNKSTAAENLEAIEYAHSVVPLILRYRKIAKLNSTYIEGIKPHIDENGYIHTCFKQTLTNTGRLSSTEPNLQNIPIRGEESRTIRSMFVASENCKLIDADYSQIELRLLAHLSEDEYFINAFKNSTDIHTLTASHIFNVEISAVTKEMRRIAKVVNFGIIYGISEYGLSSDLKISAKEAKRLIQEFYNEHPKVRQFMDNAVKLAKETGRVATMLGRSRKMLDIASTNFMVRSRAERASQNMPLQGSAADIVKLAMINVYNNLKQGNFKAKLILQVHDELIIDCPEDEIEQVSVIVQESMEKAYKLKVPLTVDITTSYRWSDGH